MIGKSLLIGISIFAALGLASPANADDYDYIDAVDNAGVPYVNDSIIDMIDLGKAVCHDLRIGVTPPVVASKLGGVGYSGWEQGTVMGAAANGMCPDTWPVLSAYATSVLPGAA